MADAIHFELGVREAAGLVANFHAADKRVQWAVRDLVRETALEVQELTRFLCPVRTGFMRDHVRHWISDKGFAFEVGWDAQDFFDAGLAFYPYFVEYGTRKMAAQPSLTPAYEHAQEHFWQDLGRVLRDALERKMRRGGPPPAAASGEALPVGAD